jgi:hypothetical protein
MEPKFEDLGFFIEYHSDNGKFLGTTLTKENDRDSIGYYSRLDFIANEDIILQNNKKIKSGTKYRSYIYPMCGKLIR